MWHEEYPETYQQIRENNQEVQRQNIIHEIAQSHRDFYDDLQHVKAVSILIFSRLIEPKWYEIEFFAKF